MLVVAQIQEIRNNLSRLLGKVRITDGSNDMPAMDSHERPGYMQASDTPMAFRLEWADASTCYAGWAAVGAGESDEAWRIKRIAVSGDDVAVEWADGDSLFDNAWDDRATITYS